MVSRAAPCRNAKAAKLFADQAVPTAGLGGNILLVDQLRGLGVARGTAVTALLLSMIGFYAAYALFAIMMLVLLWLDDRATPIIAGIVTLFLMVAAAIPSVALWLRRRGRSRFPPHLARIGFVRSLLDTVAEAPGALLRDRALLVRVTVYNGLVFIADVVTLLACLYAVGQAGSFATAFITLIMASIVATLGPIPLGLGSFEATSIATLHLLGVPFEAAFAATMLLRILILWLPLVAGMLLMRKAIARHQARS